MPNKENLQKSNEKRQIDAKAKAMKTIKKMHAEGEAINFTAVSKNSGLSKHFLYGNDEVRSTIEKYREAEVNTKINQRAKYDKTAKSKDVVIIAKDRKIAKLECENRKLKEENAILRGMVYAKRDT